MGWYRVTTLVLTGVGLITCVAFCIDYFRLSRGFRRSEYWWMLMLWPASFGALLLFVFMARLWADSIVRQIIGVALYSSFIVMVPWLHRLMRKSMRVPSIKTPIKRREKMNAPKAPFYWALFGLVVMAILTTFQQVLTDARIDSQEWVQVGIQAVMAANVYLSANLPQYRSVKKYVAAIIAGLQLLYTLIPGGVDMAEGINLAITILAALGIVFTPQPITTVVNGRTIAYDPKHGPPREATRTA